MRRPAGAGDDDLDARGPGALGEGEQPVRGAMRRHDALFADDAKRGQRFGGMAHGVPVRLATHDDGDGGGHLSRFFSGIQKHRPIIGRAFVVARCAEWAIVSWSTAVAMKKKPKLAALKAIKHRTSGKRAGTKPDQAGRVKRGKTHSK